MATLKRQRPDGKWEYVQSVGRKVITEEDLNAVNKSLNEHIEDKEKHVSNQERENWNSKQGSLNENQTRPIYVQADEPENPEENAIWIEIE